MKSKLSFALLFILWSGVTLIAQENEERFFSINYYQKLCIKDFNYFAPKQNYLLPLLNNNARIHGMELQGAIMDRVIIGLSAFGSLNDNDNNNGYTSWGGATGTISAEYRYHIKNFYISSGLGLGCGRFTYSTAFHDGSSSVTSHVDALFAEPKFKIGYVFMNKLILNADLSYIINLTGNEYNTGAEISSNVFPENLIIGVSIGYKFPFWSKKSN
mgnify:CR=1 FL=1